MPYSKTQSSQLLYASVYYICVSFMINSAIVTVLECGRPSVDHVLSECKQSVRVCVCVWYSTVCESWIF